MRWMTPNAATVGSEARGDDDGQTRQTRIFLKHCEGLRNKIELLS